MNPGYGIGGFFAALVASIAIRAPHDRRSKDVPVAVDHRGRLEVVLLALMGVAVLLLPVLYATTSFLKFADHPLTPWAFGAGLCSTTLWLWLFGRAHADLGTNWSVTLQMREGHRLITSGVYARLRHPMYTALFAQAFAQALLLPNWVAGPAMLVAFTLMFALRWARRADDARALRRGVAPYPGTWRSRPLGLVTVAEGLAGNVRGPVGTSTWCRTCAGYHSSRRTGTRPPSPRRRRCHGL
jgi:protein-S-isoprenylcysteine O-methyltransferase Ste14